MIIANENIKWVKANNTSATGGKFSSFHQLSKPIKDSTLMSLIECSGLVQNLLYETQGGLEGWIAALWVLFINLLLAPLHLLGKKKNNKQKY